MISCIAEINVTKEIPLLELANFCGEKVTQEPDLPVLFLISYIRLVLDNLTSDENVEELADQERKLPGSYLQESL